LVDDTPEKNPSRPSERGNLKAFISTNMPAILRVDAD
jgi:hypothetical protein